MELQRIYLPRRPGRAFPDIPDDPTEMTDADLMRLMTSLTKWAEFLGTQLACAEVDERHAETAMEKARALATLSGGRSVTEQKAKAYESDAYNDAREKYQTAHAYRKLVNVVFDNCDRFSALMSRELTRRVNRDPRERRVERHSA